MVDKVIAQNSTQWVHFLIASVYGTTQRKLDQGPCTWHFASVTMLSDNKRVYFTTFAAVQHSVSRSCGRVARADRLMQAPIFTDRAQTFRQARDSTAGHSAAGKGHPGGESA